MPGGRGRPGQRGKRVRIYCGLFITVNWHGFEVFQTSSVSVFVPIVGSDW